MHTSEHTSVCTILATVQISGTVSPEDLTVEEHREGDHDHIDVDGLCVNISSY